MLTVHSLETQFFGVEPAILSIENQVEKFLAIQTTKRLDVQEMLARARRRRAIRKARGSLAHVPGSVENFLHNKREDVERENSRSSRQEAAQ